MLGIYEKKNALEIKCEIICKKYCGKSQSKHPVSH